MPPAPPPPLEWHPAYRDHTSLLDWLHNLPGSPDCDRLRFPRHVSPLWCDRSPDSASPPITMAKHHAYAPAPYVGRPFCYTWTYATDNLGRSIAGEATIVYLTQ